MFANNGSRPSHRRQLNPCTTSNSASESPTDAFQRKLQHLSIDEYCTQVHAEDQHFSLQPLEESSVSSDERSFPCGSKSLLTRARSNWGLVDASLTKDATLTTSPSSGEKLVPSKWFGADINKFTEGKAGSPDFNLQLRKFIEGHVSKARRMREERWQNLLKTIKLYQYSNPALSICSNTRIPYPCLRLERSFLFDVETYPLHQILADTIGVENLSLLHEDGKDKRTLLSPLLDPDSRKAFHECYENFVTSICIPDLHSRAMSENIFNISSSSRNSDPQEICYRYQAFPCLRVMKPGEFSIGPHCDMAYGHSIGNINFHIPLTPTFGTNALYTETHPGREDWHPLTAKSCGLGYIFDGSRCLHFSLENTTDRTRVSIDFRIAIYRKSARTSSHPLIPNNNSLGISIEDDNVDDLLCSEGILEDNYSTVPGYYDEYFLEVGASSRQRARLSTDSVSRKKDRRGLLTPDRRVGFPF